MKEEMKYCKFCDEEKPIKEFVKSGFAIKNICRKCQSEKQKKIYSDSKKVRLLQSQLKAKEEIVTKLKEWLEEMLNELKQNDVYDRTSYEMGQVIATECIITKIEELEKIQELEILSKGENK